MRRKLTFATLAALAGLLCVASAAMAVRAIGVYSNDMETTAKRGQLLKLSGRNCDRGGSEIALKVEIGERTKECAYRTPVVGRDLEIVATERLLSGTPEARRRGAFLSLSLRSGGGSRYQLLVFPLQRKYQLRKVTDGEVEFLAVGKQINRIQGLNKANQLRLRAFNLLDTRDKDDCRLLVYVNGKRFAVVTDRGAGPLRGRFVSISAGAGRNAGGVIASFDDVAVRVPSPFAS